MLTSLWTILLLIALAQSSRPRKTSCPSDEGKPLFLTPYLQKGDLEGGRNASLVQGLNITDHDNIQKPAPTSYSGYFTTDPKHNSNLFFWYFPAIEPEAGWEEAPLILWLNGGPGSSSLMGLLAENGPIYATKRMNLRARKYTWAKQFNMLYVDSPAGTGFSFTDSVDGYARDELTVAAGLYSVLDQFLQLFPELRDNPFYIAGESYAGKYIPALAYLIYKTKNPSSPAHQINLVGLAIGNGYVDPPTMLDYASSLYNLGLVDELQRDQISGLQEQRKRAIEKGDYKTANSIWDEVMFGKHQQSLMINFTGIENIYNHLHTKADEEYHLYEQYINQSEVRKAIHVGDNAFHDGTIVENFMAEDEIRTVKPWLETLLNNNYKVLIYTGQNDIVVGYPLVKAFLASLKWDHSDEYRNATRKIWRVKDTDREISGYVKNVNNFWEVLVRNAGHMVPLDQPRAAKDLIERFVLDRFE